MAPLDPTLDALARQSLETARRSYPTYSHPRASKKFTLPQMIACLMLKEHLRLDYRGFVAVLTASHSLQSTLQLRHIPHYSTLARVAAKFRKPGQP